MTITIPKEMSTETLLDRITELAPLITEHAPVAERARQLTDEVVAALHAAGVFRMMVPPELGGGGLTLSDAFPVMQAAARCDGATGWNVCIGATSLAVAAARLPDDGSRRAVLGDATTRTLIAGGISPTDARAVRTARGFRFSGRVPFASGSAHATWMMMLAPVFDGDGPVLTPEGTPDLVAGLFAPSHAERLDTWHVSGLRATASSDYLVDDVFVPHERTFRLDRGPADGDPLAHLPLISRLGAGLAHVAIGIASHALDLLVDLAATKHPLGSAQPLRERADVQIDCARARALIGSAAAYVTAAWSAATCTSASGTRSLVPGDLAGLRLAYVTAAEQAAAATDLVYRAAGSSAIFERGGIERCWRDVHAVTQHFAVSTRHLERIGRITLGLDPGPGPI